MKVIEQHCEILTIPEQIRQNLLTIEHAGRICYRSNTMNEKNTTESFIKKLIKNGHLSVIEHSFLSVKFTCSRAIANEITRHRLFSFSQESTRYCRYKNNICFIKPIGICDNKDLYEIWLNSMENAEEDYIAMINFGAKTEEARNVLPLSTATTLIVSGNLRQWRHFLELRALESSGRVAPEMKELAYSLLIELYKLMPCIFEDMVEKCGIYLNNIEEITIMDFTNNFTIRSDDCKNDNYEEHTNNKKED